MDEKRLREEETRKNDIRELDRRLSKVEAFVWAVQHNHSKREAEDEEREEEPK